MTVDEDKIESDDAEGDSDQVFFFDFCVEEKDIKKENCNNWSDRPEKVDFIHTVIIVWFTEKENYT